MQSFSGYDPWPIQSAAHACIDSEPLAAMQIRCLSADAPETPEDPAQRRWYSHRQPHGFIRSQRQQGMVKSLMQHFRVGCVCSPSYTVVQAQNLTFVVCLICPDFHILFKPQQSKFRCFPRVLSPISPMESQATVSTWAHLGNMSTALAPKS